MAQQHPRVGIPRAPTLSTIAGVAPNSVLRLDPNRRLWKAQDTIPGQARRILAEYHLQGASSWAVPAGTVDPTSAGQGYPHRDTWRTVAIHHARQSPGTKLACHCIYCPAGQTQSDDDLDGQWTSTGSWAELRVRCTWVSADATNAVTQDFDLSMEGSNKGDWGGAENTAAGSDWHSLREKLLDNIMPLGFESDPQVGVVFSEAPHVQIELQVRGGERIVHAIVYEVPSVYTLAHDDEGPLSVHGAPPGSPEKPRRPQTDMPDGVSWEHHRWGTGFLLKTHELQAARLGPRIMQWAANSHSGTDWDETQQVPITVGASLTLANLFLTSQTGWASARPSWLVAGSMAQLHRLHGGTNFMRGRAAVVPVRVIVDGVYTGSQSTLRLQSSEYEWIDIALPATRGEVTAYGYLASQVYGDHFAGLLQPLITTPGGSSASLYNISVEFYNEQEDPMASLLASVPSVLATFAADAGPSATTSATNMVDVPIPANTLDEDGQSLHVELFGDLLNTSGVSVTWEIAVLLGGVELFRDTSGSYASSASVRVWTNKFIITRKSATTCQLGGRYGWETTGTAPDTGLGGIDSGKNSSNTRSPATSPTVAWGSAQDLEVRITCSSNHASTRYTLRGGYVMKIPNAS